MAGLISLEDHFTSKAMLTSPNVATFRFDLYPEEIKEKLFSVGSRRIRDMGLGDISLQVVSSIPAPESLEVCQGTNNQLDEAVRSSEGRLAGFAMLPMADPTAAAEEIERCVQKLGFVGALIPNHADGIYYDSNEYRIFWERAQRFDVPIYLHPSPASTTARPSFEGNYSKELSAMLSAGGWGWHADVALHFLKLFASGLFDTFPRLKLILGHAGEMLPYMIYRVNRRLGHGFGSINRKLMTVWTENVWITISGIWDLGPFACLIRSVAMDRILYSVDYPFERNEAGRDFMAVVRNSGLVTEDEWEMIAHRNAETLLKIRRPKRPTANGTG
jgi:predicted TIM-barrel fold metal-dependent hydrolase